MNVSQCDNCKRLDPASPPPGWLILFTAEPLTSALSLLTGGGPDIQGMFCSWRCVAEYATVRALVPGSSEGGET